jgi:hypothetical protein
MISRIIRSANMVVIIDDHVLFKIKGSQSLAPNFSHMQSMLVLPQQMRSQIASVHLHLTFHLHSFNLVIDQNPRLVEALKVTLLPNLVQGGTLFLLL